jgi:hypothetical protein
LATSWLASLPGSGSTFPIGTISTGSTATGGAGSRVNPQVGAEYPTAGLPAFLSVLVNCGNERFQIERIQKPIQHSRVVAFSDGKPDSTFPENAPGHRKP